MTRFFIGFLAMSLLPTMSWSACDNEKEIIKARSFFKREGKVLTVQLANQKSLVFENREGGDESRRYCVAAYFPAFDSFILNTEGYEYTENEWIDRQGGGKTSIGSQTVVSPDGGRIVSIARDWDCGMSGDVFIGIWRVSQGMIVREYFQDLSGGTTSDLRCPKKVAWKSTGSVSVAFETAPAGEPLTQTLELVRGRWVWSGR